MQDNKASEGGVRLREIFIPDTDLPQNIFLRAFSRYLFFDADIGSSDDLISTLQEVAKVCLGPDLRVDIFSASDLRFLGRLSANSNWVAEVNEINKSMRRTGDCGGLILVDISRRWAVYQKRPVDLGVFAFNCMEGMVGLESAMDDCFFACDDVANWLLGKTERDIDLVSNFGRGYLVSLMKNYCSARS